ncbi:uncharacterized protein BXZ73DRAFT_90588 [Epithele typhae]|uniref:uncharacterized protein n=1 Tax=Epithele typhae TaxID=378194 RepID=UPI002007B417|nr:uncharacterized protein BXZ73DRAFT_90588 [Epithele typhae]KAH9928535.1 hypothetical protein BXZ73DRAFT_90588 [Epithele typhae]
MRFSTVAAALLPVGLAMAQTTHTVQVGGAGKLVYTPNELTGVANGDVIQFQFMDKNHTVTQSTFPAPCSNITDASGAVTGVDSGFQFVDPTSANVPVWQITINNASAPLWFYCRQAKHCQAGMVFAVNPTAAKTFDMFKTTAASSNSVNGSPAAASNSTSSAASSGSSGSVSSPTSSSPSGSSSSPSAKATGNSATTLGAAGTFAMGTFLRC